MSAGLEDRTLTQCRKLLYADSMVRRAYIDFISLTRARSVFRNRESVVPSNWSGDDAFAATMWMNRSAQTPHNYMNSRNHTHLPVSRVVVGFITMRYSIIYLYWKHKIQFNKKIVRICGVAAQTRSRSFSLMYYRRWMGISSNRRRSSSRGSITQRCRFGKGCDRKTDASSKHTRIVLAETAHSDRYASYAAHPLTLLACFQFKWHVPNSNRLGPHQSTD